MKNYITLLFVFLMLPFIAISQKNGDKQENDSIPKKIKPKLERAAFESSYIIDNPTNVVLNKKALDVSIVSAENTPKLKALAASNEYDRYLTVTR